MDKKTFKKSFVQIANKNEFLNAYGGCYRKTNNIILALTQANIYGSSIISTMYNQVDYLREKRKMEVKATISKIPTKISIISVFFFIPLILLIILGPAILSYIK